MASLRAGAARGCITPWLRPGHANWVSPGGRQDIHDDLYAKAIVLENDDTAVAIVICDLGVILQEDADAAKESARRLTGIPKENILIAATHIHSGPATIPVLGGRHDDLYMTMLPDRIATAVKLAHNQLRPAEVAAVSAECHGESFNRRWRLTDGSIRNNFALAYQDPRAVEPVGPIDPEVGVLVVRDLERRPIAVLANFALHYMGALGDPGPAYSADYFGEFDRALQRMAGCDVVGIMSNGCCGDINQIDISRPKPELPDFYYHVRRLANVMAAKAYGAWQGLRDFDFDREPALAAATEAVLFRPRRPSEEQLQRARALLAGTAPLDGEPRLRPWEFKHWEMTYAQELVLLDQEPAEQRHPIMALRVGDLGIVGLPGEAFVEYGLDIKRRSPFERTMTIELANDYVTYLATDKAMTEVPEGMNSYDTTLARSSKTSLGTQEAFVSTAVRALERVRQ